MMGRKRQIPLFNGGFGRGARVLWALEKWRQISNPPVVGAFVARDRPTM